MTHFFQFQIQEQRHSSRELCGQSKLSYGALIQAVGVRSKKQTVQPGEAFEDTTFKPGFVIVRF
jgi:hypothetical protein